MDVDQSAIVGIGQTRFAKALVESESELAVGAVLAALDDAGIGVGEVDGLASFTMESTSEVEIARNLGLGDVRFFSKVDYGGGGGCGTVAHLAMAVGSGLCTVGVGWRSRKRGSGGRPWVRAGLGEPRVPGEVPRVDDWYRPWGLLRPVDQVAMLARRYMHEYGISRDHLANVAIALRTHAGTNPAALMRRPLARDEYMAARWISEPLCLFDNCLETDGALAVVVVPAARAKDCRRRPVYVHAFAQGFGAQQQAMVDYHSVDPLAGASAVCARALWQRAEVGPVDIDVAQFYDAFSPEVLFALEAYGFCGRGEGGAFTEDGGIEGPGARLPVNTSGGSLSEAYVHGYNLIVEGVRQIRGSSTCQVRDAHTCLVTSGGSVPTSAVVLRG